MSTIPLASSRTRPRPAPVARPESFSAAPEYGFGFFLFLLVNAALFVRPADIVPELHGVEIYQYLILTCLLFSFPAVLASLSPSKLESRPADLFVLALLPAIAFSLVPYRNWGEMYEACFAFAKILVYYFLLVSLVTTPKRLRTFLACIAFFSVLTVLISILDHHKLFIQIPRTATRDAHGTLTIDPNRMYGPGIFADPNDVCVLIATSLMIILGRLGDRRLGQSRFFWLVGLAIFGYGFYLTQSRGGLLALFAGLGTFIWLRFGIRNAILLGLLLFPGIVFFLGARQAGVSLDAETGQERLQLWNAGLVYVRNNPIFGVGWGHFANAGEATHVAHNSYMNVFGELGMFGGTLFLGMFGIVLWGLYRLTRPVPVAGQLHPVRPTIVDPDLRQLFPYLAGAIAAYAAGMMTLTLVLLGTTYALVAAVMVFVNLAKTWPERPPLKFDLLMPVRFFFLSVLYLAVMFVFIRVGMRI